MQSCMLVLGFLFRILFFRVNLLLAVIYCILLKCGNYADFLQLDFCGHGTLASAHLVFSANIVEGDTALFYTKAGVLTANKVSGYEEFEESPEGAVSADPPATRKPSSKGVVELDFPLVVATECNEASLLSEVLGGVEVKWIGRSNLGDYLVRVGEFYIPVGVDITL